MFTNKYFKARPGSTIPQSDKLKKALFWYALFNYSEIDLLKFCEAAGV